MENQLQKITTDLYLNTPLNEKEIEIAKLIYHVNYIIAYPLSDLHLEGWAKSINELKPELNIENLKKVIDKFKLADLQWDTKKGIQNIFIGLKRVEGITIVM